MRCGWQCCHSGSFIVIRNCWAATCHCDCLGRNGARTLNFDQTGVLAPGNAADLIVVDTTAAHFQPLHNVIAALVWCTDPGDVRDVMVAGRWLMRDRRLLTLDEQAVLDGFQNELQRMLGRPLAQFRRYGVLQDSPQSLT